MPEKIDILIKNGSVIEPDKKNYMQKRHCNSRWICSGL